MRSARIRLSSRSCIARRVPGGIVDHLEAVEVDEAQRMLVARSWALARARCSSSSNLVRLNSPVRGIVGGVIAQLALHRPGLGDVLEHQHGADDLAIAGAHRRRAILDIVLLALAADQRGAVLQVEHRVFCRQRRTGLSGPRRCRCRAR